MTEVKECLLLRHELLKMKCERLNKIIINGGSAA